MNAIKKSIYEIFPKTISLWAIIFYFFLFFFLSYIIFSSCRYIKNQSILISDESRDNIDGL